MNRILIVENDRALVASLHSLLQTLGYSVSSAYDLKTAYEVLGKQGFELVLLDRVLDDGDGLEIANFLHEVSFGTKILFMSQKGEVAERLIGLNSGADDYLPKPFNTQELVQKVKLLLLRQKIKDQSYLQVGHIHLNPSSGTLTLNDKQSSLRRRESQILACLLRMQGTVVSKSALIEYVWQSEDEIPTYTTLEVYIRRLRMALGNHHGYIKTVRGFGYRLSI